MIRVSTRKHKAWDGYYVPHYSDRTGELKEHRITIYLQDNSRDFEATLAHELIHAWQEENNKAEYHGWHFKRIAKRMEKHFNMTKIYIKGQDI